LAADGNPQNLATAVTDVSERMSTLVREEIELAKAEVSEKATSMARGAGAIAAGAAFGVFALIFLLETIAWAINAIFIDGAGDLWLGFLVVFVILLVLTIVSGLFAWRKLRVGPPKPTMAIDEAKRIRETVVTKGQGA
jgi:Putative Actinobacterial Holin-X, holin superfamily III